MKTKATLLIYSLFIIMVGGACSLKNSSKTPLLIDVAQTAGPNPYSVRLTHYPSPGEMVAFSLNIAQKRIESVSLGQDYRTVYPEVFALGGINRIEGLVYDRENNDMILVGRHDPAGPALTLDDFAVALRARFIHENWPLVSIDPSKDWKKNNMQDVRLGGGIEDTQFGADLLDADYRLKLIGMGLLDAGVKEVKSVLDITITTEKKAILQGTRTPEENINVRLWFYPIQPSVAVRQNVISVKGLSVGLFTEVLEATIDGKPVEDITNYQNLEYDQFKTQFTTNFAKLATIHASFFRMRGLDELVSLSQALKIMEGTPDINFWLMDYSVKTVKMPRTITTKKNTKSYHIPTSDKIHTGSYTLSGGVQLMAIALRLRSGDVTALSSAVLTTRPNTSALSWQFIVAQWVIPTSPGQVETQNLGQFFAQALFLEEQKNWDSAIALYNKLIGLQKDWEYAYNNRGHAYYMLGQHDMAIADLTKALEINPLEAMFYNNRGLIYQNWGRLEESLADFSVATELNPNFVNAFKNRGIVNYKLGQNNNALASFNRAMELNPHDDGNYFDRGLLYYRLGRLSEAMSDYTRALELNPRNADAYHNRGAIYYESGHHQKAIADYTHTIELNPSYVNAYYNRGFVYNKLGNLEKALEDLTHALEQNPSLASAYYTRGTVYYKLGNLEKALEDLTHALELNPRDADFYTNRGIIYYELGRIRHACSDFQQASELGMPENYYIIRRNHNC